jgi:hypothetical protein
MATPRKAHRKPLGAYGFRIEGIEAERSLLTEVEPDWPRLRLRSELGPVSEDPYDRVDELRAVLKLRGGGRILLDRAAGTVVFASPRPPRPDELIHPYLAPAAAVAAYWLGRESLHAGAFVAGGNVWALLGDREAGKSSTLAWLASSRRTLILCDDMLILDDDGGAYAGPRSIDLRPDVAERLGISENLGVVGTRERWRLRLEPVASSLPFRGWFALDWGDRFELRPLGAAERLSRLSPSRGVRLPPPSPETLFELVRLPGWELRRPRGLESLAAGAELLLETAAS